MKHLLLFVTLLFAATSAVAQEAPKYEFRSNWIASVFGLDWPVRGASPASQQAHLIRLLDDAKNNGLNAVLLQVRNEADALYDSPYEPWSYYLTGRQGQAPVPFWDPLEFAVEEAHKRGLELHAWLNPYRAESTSGQHSPLDPNHIIFQKPEWIMEFPRSASADFKMLNPGIPEVWDYVAMIAADVAARYDIDGIQFDDYFYPYNVPGRLPNGIRNSDDQATFEQYNRGFTNRNAWRRDNVNQLIKRVHDEIKAVKPWIKFGISPFGIHKIGTPAGITGLDAYNDIHTDAPAWTEGEYVDYLAPQLYWDFGGGQDYGRLAPWWATQMNGRHLYIGQAVYRELPQIPIPATNIARQVRLNRDTENIHGSIFFRADHLRRNYQGYRDTLRTLYSSIALAPPMRWNNPDSEPGAPVLVRVRGSLNGPQISWTEPGWQTIDHPYMDGARIQIPNKEFIVYRYADGEEFDINSSKHLLARVHRSETTFTDRTGTPGVKYNYILTTVDRAGIESAPAAAVSMVWTDLEEGLVDVPQDYELLQNYPNPFNPTTVIEFKIPVSQDVRLEVFNALGQRVSMLQNGYLSSGTHRVTFDASHLSSGIYLYRLSAGNITLTQKMTLFK